MRSGSELWLFQWITQKGKVFSLTFYQSNVFRLLAAFRGTHKAFFYELEKLSYIALLISYVIWHIDPRMIGASIAGLCVVIGLTVIVMVNEIYADQVFSKLS